MTANDNSSTSMLTVVLELGGGTELLTATKKTKRHTLQVPAQVAPDELARDADTAAGVSDGAAGGDGADADKDAANGVRHPTTVRDFIQLVCRDLIVERHGMLVESDGSIRPGILVLINDADWELEGELEYELQDGDHICLISTLHGG